MVLLLRLSQNQNQSNQIWQFTKNMCNEPIRAQSKTLRLVVSVGKVANIPVVVFYFVPLSRILPGLVLKPGLHLLVMSVVDWKTSPLTDLAERLVLLVLGPHPHSTRNDFQLV